MQAFVFFVILQENSSIMISDSGRLANAVVAQQSSDQIPSCPGREYRITSRLGFVANAGTIKDMLDRIVDHSELTDRGIPLPGAGTRIWEVVRSSINDGQGNLQLGITEIQNSGLAHLHRLYKWSNLWDLEN